MQQIVEQRRAMFRNAMAVNKHIRGYAHVGSVHDDVHLRRDASRKLGGDWALVVASGSRVAVTVNDVHATRTPVEPDPWNARPGPAQQQHWCMYWNRINASMAQCSTDGQYTSGYVTKYSGPAALSSDAACR